MEKLIFSGYWNDNFEDHVLKLLQNLMCDQKKYQRDTPLHEKMKKIRKKNTIFIQNKESAFFGDICNLYRSRIKITRLQKWVIISSTRFESIIKLYKIFIAKVHLLFKYSYLADHFWITAGWNFESGLNEQIPIFILKTDTYVVVISAPYSNLYYVKIWIYEKWPQWIINRNVLINFMFIHSTITELWHNNYSETGGAFKYHTNSMSRSASVVSANG